MKESYQTSLVVAVVLILFPSMLIGLVFGIGSILHMVRIGGGSAELWLSRLSYVTMLAASMITAIGLARRRERQMSIGLLVLSAGWVGAAWDRHRQEFTEWELVVAVVGLILAVVMGTANRSRGAESE